MRQLGSALTLVIAVASAFGEGCHTTAASVTGATAPPNEVWISQDQMDRSGVAVGPVDDHSIDDTVLASGRVAFDDARVAHEFSPVAGRVTQIKAVLGQTVKKGDALAIIQSPDIGNASSDVGKAQADLTAAEHANARQQRLLGLGATSQSDAEAAQDNYERAKAELDRATQRSVLMGAGGNVTQSFTLRSSIDGDVIARSINPGMEVQSQYSVGSAVELFTIGTIENVWVLADVYEIDAERVKAGDKSKVKIVAIPDRTFDGTVDYVGEMLDPVSRTLKVRCVLENKDHALKPEMYATVAISVDARTGLAIPRAAVLRLGEQTVVFVDKGASPNGLRRFVRVPVTIDERSPEGLVPLKHGVAKGDVIAVAGAQILSSLM
jgi:cobalt-zinc-cadmium efflux system membrane fusion protein